MRRFKKVMLMTGVISGVGLVAAGSAQAAECGHEPPPANTQLLNCEQTFKSSLVTINAPITVGGDVTENIGNFCTALSPHQ